MAAFFRSCNFLTPEAIHGHYLKFGLAVDGKTRKSFEGRKEDHMASERLVNRSTFDDIFLLFEDSTSKISIRSRYIEMNP